MSREIKFRAYDKHLKVIRDVVSMEYEDREIKYWLDDEYFSPIERSFDEVILMQYTGAKDKNDKEIYEGDILAWHWNEIDLKDKDTEVGVVEYDEETMQYVLNKYETKYYPAINNDASYDNGKRALESLFYPEYDYKVIGNIYKSPELMKIVK